MVKTILEIQQPTELEKCNKKVSELLDDKDVCDLLINRLEDGGHVAKKPATASGDMMTGGTWQYFLASFHSFCSLQHCSGGQWLLCPWMNNPYLPTGSASSLGQGVEEGDDNINNGLNDEDTIDLLDEGELLGILL